MKKLDMVNWEKKEIYDYMSTLSDGYISRVCPGLI